jgi:hypothetical protein
MPSVLILKQIKGFTCEEMHFHVMDSAIYGVHSMKCPIFTGVDNSPVGTCCQKEAAGA